MKRLYDVINYLSVLLYIITIGILVYLTHLVILYGDEVFSIFIVLFPALMLVLLVTIVVCILEIIDYHKKGNRISLIPKVNASYTIAMIFSFVNGMLLIKENKLLYLGIFTFFGLLFFGFYLIHRIVYKNK